MATATAETPAVLLVHDEYAKFYGGNSSINNKVLDIIKEYEPGIPVVCTVLKATEEEKQKALNVGVTLLPPKLDQDDNRAPSLDWLTFDHHSRYPHLPSKIRSIVGHAGITSRAAVRIKQERYPDAKLILVTSDIPEDTEYYKGDEKAMGIGKKEDSILEDAQEADVVFSLGDKIFDHFDNQFRAISANKQPKHVKFIPRSSKIFEDARAEYKDTKTMVVLSIGRVKGVEKLSTESLSIVADKMNIKWRVIVNKDDFEATNAILEQYKSANLQITLIPYGTQEDICKEMMKAHLVLMPSRAEPFGLVGLEAIAAGVPVLVSSRCGLAGFIHEHVDELHHSIVDMDGSDKHATVKVLAQGIERMLKHNKTEFKTAARGKQQLLSSNYWEEFHHQFIQACTDEGHDSQPATVKKRKHSANIEEAGEGTNALKQEAMVLSLSKEVTRLTTKDEQAQKVLLEHEIQQLKDTNRAKEAKIEELTMENIKLFNQLKDASDQAGTWKRDSEVSGYIGIIGASGAGKSTFINSIRGLRPRDPGATKVGVKETTKDIEECRHPVHTNVIIVDFPGALFELTGRLGKRVSFRTDRYTERVEKKMKECNIFLVFTSGRVHNNAVWIAAKARSMGKKVLFVRSKVDTDIQDIQRDEPEYFDKGQEEGEKHLLQELRQDLVRIFEQMQYGQVDIADVFIISGLLIHIRNGRWDAPALERAILNHLTVKEQSSSPSPRRRCVLF